ncbi:hypothetical protein HERIO_1383 [Hepatospora eriocheir]|uniref:Uncharacterized protein n=1 Tax=Hepatospora eriocheir TaxID=1081669 RepID=A0A1X0QAC4_9MICR|nr:hypothetical protein HERIO_1383 [Hepatospora eriocheir]
MNKFCKILIINSSLVSLLLIIAYISIIKLRIEYKYKNSDELNNMLDEFLTKQHVNSLYQ